MVLAGFTGHVLLAALLLQTMSVLDGVDGEIARAKGLGSEFGALLDTVLDYTVDSLGALALVVALYVRGDISAEVGMFAGGGTVMVRLISQYIVKNVVESRHHIVRDQRDVMTMAILAGAAGALLWGGWVLLIVLGAVNLVRIDNSIYRMRLLYVSSREAVTATEAETLTSGEVGPTSGAGPVFP